MALLPVSRAWQHQPQPHDGARVADRFADRLALVIDAGCLAHDPAPYVGRASDGFAAIGTQSVGPSGVGFSGSSTSYVTARTTATSPDELLQIQSGSDWSMQFVVDNVGIASGTVPCWFRGGSTSAGPTFLATNTTTRRPWVRLGGTDILKPASGYQWTDGTTLNLILRIKSGSFVDIWLDGVQRYSASHAVATPAMSGVIDGIYTLLTNSGTENIRANLAAFRAWRRYLTDAEASELAGNQWSLFEPQRIWVPVAAGGGSYSLQVTPGSYTISGQDVSLVAARSLAANAGSYAITGNDVVLTKGVVLSALAGSYAITGNDAALTASRALTVTAGAYSITGNDVALVAARILTATAGAYSITGSDVQLTYNPVGSYTLSVTPGAYAITGNDVALTASRIVSVTAGSYTISGSTVTLTYGVMHTLSVTPGTYAITGYSATLNRTALLGVTAGAYAYTGRSVVLTYSGLADGALDEVLLFSRLTPSVELLSELTQTVRLSSPIP